MIRKYYNHKLQSYPWHHKEELHKITRHQEDKLSKATISLFPHPDDCKTRIDIEEHTTKHRTITDPQWELQ